MILVCAQNTVIWIVVLLICLGAQTVSVGQQIVLGERNRSCTWTVSTDTSPEHYVSTIDILVINPARLGDAGVYKCSSGQTLVLNCPVTVFFKPGLHYKLPYLNHPCVIFSMNYINTCISHA